MPQRTVALTLPWQQTAAGRELRTLEDEYLALVAKNAELETACAAVEAEASELRATLPPGAVASLEADSDMR